ncbi:MAG: hypothetical protein U0412_02035 [Nitrospira sp.]
MILQSTLDFLAQDATPIGAVTAPVISWCGAVGLTLFFAWHTFRLYRLTADAQWPFIRVAARLTPLIRERRRFDREHPESGGPGTRRNPTRLPATELNRRDREDFQKTDAIFQQEPALAAVWTRYRQTLVTEQVPWYVEPRIFSSRSAGELFVIDAMDRGRLNLAWYHQIPSLLTGIGLLLTFVALLVGLSKLHADGHTIVGIQGLINGLAGKFLTSIVGLVYATCFTLIEKPLVFRLQNVHRQCMHLLDELFPRKTLEQMLESFSGFHANTESHGPAAVGLAPQSTLHSTAPESLTEPLTVMTRSIDALTRELRSHLRDIRPTPSESTLPALADTLAPLIRELTAAVDRLSTTQGPPPSTQSVDALVADLTARIDRPLPSTGSHIAAPATSMHRKDPTHATR